MKGGRIRAAVLGLGLFGLGYTTGCDSPTQEEAPAHVPSLTIEEYLQTSDAQHRLILFPYSGPSGPPTDGQGRPVSSRQHTLSAVPDDYRNLVRRLTEGGGSYTLRGIGPDDHLLATALPDMRTTEGIRREGSLDVVFVGNDISTAGYQNIESTLGDTLGYGPKTRRVW